MTTLLLCPINTGDHWEIAFAFPQSKKIVYINPLEEQHSKIAKYMRMEILNLQKIYGRHRLWKRTWKVDKRSMEDLDWKRTWKVDKRTMECLDCGKGHRTWTKDPWKV